MSDMVPRLRVAAMLYAESDAVARLLREAASEIEGLRALSVRIDELAAGATRLGNEREQFLKERDSLLVSNEALQQTIREAESAVERLRIDADAGRELWAYMVDHGIPWSDPDWQEALTDMGLLVAKDMDAEDSGPECDNCNGDCGTCYRASATLLVAPPCFTLSKESAP